MNAHAHGIGTRFQHRQDPPVPDLRAQAGQGGFDGRGVVGEIVVNPDITDAATQLHAPLHVLEQLQSIDGNPHGHAGMTGGGNSRQGIVHVVHAGQIPAQPTRLLILADHVEGAAIGGEVVRPPGALPLCGKILHGRPAAHVQHLVQVAVILWRNDEAGRRHGAHQMVKLALDLRQVIEDIRVVEFQIVHHQGARMVVNELAALVEEGGIVFIRFHHEEGHVTEARRLAKIARHAADEEARLQPAMLQYPGQHGRRGGLAVSAGYRQHPASLENVLCQPLRA